MSRSWRAQDRSRPDRTREGREDWREERRGRVRVSDPDPRCPACQGLGWVFETSQDQRPDDQGQACVCTRFTR